MSQVYHMKGSCLVPWTLCWSADRVANDNGAGSDGLLDYRQGQFIRGWR